MSKLFKHNFIGYHLLDSLTQNQKKLFGVVNPACIKGMLDTILIRVEIGQFIKVVPCQSALSVFFNPVGVTLFDEANSPLGVSYTFAVVVNTGNSGNHEVEVVAAVVIFWFILC